MYLGRNVSGLAVVIVALSPALHLVLPQIGGGMLYVLLAISLWGMGSDWRRYGHIKWPQWRRWIPLMAACAGLLLAIAAGHLLRGAWHGASFEKALRFAMIVPILWLFMRIEPARLRQAQWGILAGALFAGGLLIFPQALISGSLRPDTAAYSLYNTVGFAALTLLYAVLSLMTLNWKLTRFTRSEAAFKILAVLIALLGVFRSETRTVLLALPGFALIALVMLRSFSWRLRLVLVITVLLGVGLTVSNTEVWHNVIKLGANQAYECLDAPTTDTSVCIRLQLWRAALNMLEEAPVFGVGAGDSFSVQLQSQARRGEVSAYVAQNFGETHNDYLFMAAAHGGVGLFAFLLAFFVTPGWYFARRLGRADHVQAWAAAMGLAIVLGFAAFSLTEMMFRAMRTVSFYTAWLAYMLALAWQDAPDPRLEPVLPPGSDAPSPPVARNLESA